MIAQEVFLILALIVACLRARSYRAELVDLREDHRGLHRDAAAVRAAALDAEVGRRRLKYGDDHAECFRRDSRDIPSNLLARLIAPSERIRRETGGVPYQETEDEPAVEGGRLVAKAVPQ